MSASFHAASRVPVLTAQEMRAWDAYAIQTLGVPERVLMESAGRAAAALVQRLYPDGRVVAVAGGGNNGGDALVAARTLAAWGRPVEIVWAVDRPCDPTLLHGWTVPVRELDEIEAALAGAGVILDGVLGTGARGAPRGPALTAIDAMNAAMAPVVALDGPSGVDMTTGAAEGHAVRAAATITFGAPKRGLLRFPGRTRAGRILVCEVGFPRLTGFGAELVTPRWASAHLPERAPDAHKGESGRVLLLAGRAGMGGAALLCARGALRAGAGYAVVASAPENRVVVQTGLPEALFVVARDAAQGEAERADAVLAGPGMGTDDEAASLLRRVLAAAAGPLLLDADALTLLSAHGELRDACREPPLLTPHPGEMARLLGRDTASVLADPFAAAEEAAERYDAVVLLKGAPSVVAGGGEPALVSVAGHSGIATGGMGDVLGGVAAAMLAAGAAPREAAGVALYFAGRAATLAHRGRGLLASQVADAVPQALAERGDSAEPWPGVVLDLPPAE